MPVAQRNTIVLSVIAAFTLLQLIILHIFGYTPYPDSEGYIGLAKECLEAGEPYPTAFQYKEHVFIWNLGAINIVALSLWLFKSITPLLVLYSFMKGATAWLLYQITEKTVNKKTAFTALLIYVLYPANYGESTSTLSELPFIFFCLAGILCALNRKAMSGGILMAIGNWFRPMGMVFLLSAIIFLLFKKEKRKAVNLTAGYLACIIFIGGINFLRIKHFTFQAQTGWMALMQYSWDNDPNRSENLKLFPNGNPMYYGQQTDCGQRDNLWKKNFFIWLQHNPQEYLKQMPLKLAKTYISDNVNFCTFLSGKEEKDYMYEELSMKRLVADFPHLSKVQSLTLYNLFYYYMLIICFFMSCISLLKRRETQFVVLPISIVTIGTAVLLFFGHGEARFHIPFMPFIIMSVAAWLSIRIKPKYNNNEEKISICHKQCP